MVRLLGEVTEPKPAPAPTCDICGCCTPTQTPHEPQQADESDTDYGEIVPATVCPNCKTEIDHLDVEMIIHRTGTFGQNGIDDPDDEIIMAVYRCPECNTILCDCEEDAMERVAS